MLVLTRRRPRGWSPTPGIANPRFIRLTTYNFPTADDLARQTGVPLGAIVQPMATLAPTEVRACRQAGRRAGGGETGGQRVAGGGQAGGERRAVS